LALVNQFNTLPEKLRGTWSFCKDNRREGRKEQPAS